MDPYLLLKLREVMGSGTVSPSHEYGPADRDAYIQAQEQVNSGYQGNSGMPFSGPSIPGFQGAPKEMWLNLPDQASTDAASAAAYDRPSPGPEAVIPLRERRNVCLLYTSDAADERS